MKDELVAYDFDATVAYQSAKREMPGEEGGTTPPRPRKTKGFEALRALQNQVIASYKGNE